MITAADMDELENMVEMTLREWDQEFAQGFAGERLDLMQPGTMEGETWQPTTEPQPETAFTASPASSLATPDQPML